MRKLSLAIPLFIGMVLVGCGTMTLQTSSKLTRSITLDHSQIKRDAIYVQVTNTANSGGEKMHLKEGLIKELKQKGYSTYIP